ncbi:hypothetical protein NEDG_00197 [Nematocida displodere]|uniref:RING-type domain-containing protein n=1 Tax=Nematocida displodere TaxID=1805483 RepID=A0A177EKT1_9MICR|nr:hypothetical protein NEDG_00197 [Nematocida displodere]
MRHSSHLATRKDAHTPPKPRKRLPLRKILVALAAAFLYTAVMGSTTEITTTVVYLDSPYTHQTLAFFMGASGCILETYTANRQTYICKDQRGSKVEVNLKAYTPETVPEHMVEGMLFESLTIGNMHMHGTEKQHQPLNREVLEKVFRALGTVYLETLAIIGVDIEAPFQDTNTLPRPANALGVPSTTQIPRIFKVCAEEIELKGMSAEFAGWILGSLDVSESNLDLCIYDAPAIANLLFLDNFNPNSLLTLYLHNLENLTNIDCALLEEKRVLRELTIQGANNYLSASLETLQAISTKAWERLQVPADLWYNIVVLGDSAIVVNSLLLTINFIQAVDSFWGMACARKAEVGSLDVRLLAVLDETPSKKGLKDIFMWVCRCFVGTEEIRVVRSNIPAPTRTAVSSYLYMEPLLPKLKFLYCSPTNGLYLYLYSGKSTLWIVPEAYQEWAWGNLNNQMVRASQEFICPILESTHPGLFLASPNTSPNPTCLVCGQSVNDFNEMGPQTRPKYLGIVCKAGHMACHPCLNKLSLEKHSAKELLHCPECNDEIVDTGINGVIRKNIQGLFNFKIIKLSPRC